MIDINIPGRGDLTIESLVIDLNGTIATDGKIPSEVKERIQLLSRSVQIYILTADTQGTAQNEIKDMRANLVRIEEEDSKKGKFEFIKGLDLEKTVAIGNGHNDQFVLKEAALGIAVLGDEGLAVSALKQADVVVKNISDALDLFLRQKRLMATLRE